MNPFKLSQVKKAELRKKWEMFPFHFKRKMKRFLNYVPNTISIARKVPSYIWNEWNGKEKLPLAINYLGTGALVWVAVNWFNTIISYSIIIVLVHHELPQIIEIIKGKR